MRLLAILLLWASLQSVIAADFSTAASRSNSNASNSGVSALALDPTQVCTALKSEGLQTRGKYKEISDGKFRCTSRSKPLTAGGGKVHEIRFYATGTENSIEQLDLELSVYTREDMQRSHRKMVEIATLLTERTLQMALPTEVSNAILGGVVNGSWQINQRLFTLLRKSVSPWGHTLEITIR